MLYARSKAASGSGTRTEVPGCTGSVGFIGQGVWVRFNLVGEKGGWSGMAGL